MKNFIFQKNNFQQLITYGLVGLTLNVAGYFVYILVTWLGIEPKLAVTILYPLSVFYGYFTHSRISFRNARDDHDISSIIRYVFVYIVGYLLNISLMYLFHDRFGFPHQLVQATSIFLIAGFLFIALKLFVFRELGR